MALQINFGKAIQIIRKQHQLSQEQLALSAGIDRRYMSDIENGKRNISLDIIERLAGSLNVSISDLIRHAERMEDEPFTIDGLKQWLIDNENEDAVMFESPNYQEAIIGISEDGRLIYSYSQMIDCLVKEEGMSQEEAMEYIDYNTLRSLPYAGEKAPIVMYDLGC